MDIETIAKALTKAQREVVLALNPPNHWSWDVAKHVAQRLSWGLRFAPLVEQMIVDRRAFRLTALGVQVRARLLESQS